MEIFESDRRWKKALDNVRDGDSEGALFILKGLYRDGELATCREIGRVYERLKDYTKAKKWYLKSIDEAEDIEGYIGCAKLAFFGWGEHSSYSNALGFLQEIESNQNHKALLLQGQIYSAMQQLEKSYNYFESSFNLGNIVALNEMAKIDKERNKFFKWMLRKCVVFVKTFLIALKDPYSEFIRTKI